MVREFSARAPLHDGDFVGIPRHDVHTSRWVASPTTFGAAGRIVVTVAVFGLLMVGLFFTGGLFNPFGLWFILGWSVVAVFVLRQIWQPVRVDRDRGGVGLSIRRRFPRLAVPVPLRAIGAVIGLTILLATAYGWTMGDSLARFGIVIAGVMFGLIAILLWLTDS